MLAPSKLMLTIFSWIHFLTLPQTWPSLKAGCPGSRGPAGAGASA